MFLKSSLHRLLKMRTNRQQLINLSKGRHNDPRYKIRCWALTGQFGRRYDRCCRPFGDFVWWAYRPCIFLSFCLWSRQPNDASCPNGRCWQLTYSCPPAEPHLAEMVSRSQLYPPPSNWSAVGFFIESGSMRFDPKKCSQPEVRPSVFRPRK